MPDGNTVLFIADKRIPDDAKYNLQRHGDLLQLYVSDITYEAIAGHPDIFFCKTNNQLITAPNLPYEFKNILTGYGINFIEGDNNVSSKYPGTAIYNAVSTPDYLIHKLSITDPVILKYSEGIEKINIEQGYSRCSLVPLKDNNFITSDEGIYKTLTSKGFKGCLVSSKEVLLPGFQNGLIGGAFGIYGNRVFIIGSLKYYSEGEKIRDYLSSLSYEIIELYEGPLFDGGSIIIL